MDIQKINQTFNSYFRPQTFPLAIRLVQSAEEIPERAKRPKRDFGINMALCQAVALSRRSGWVIAMGREDMICPVGAITLGFYPASTEFLDGSLEIPFWADQENRAKMAESIPRLERKYNYVVMAPLERTTFEPDVIVVYGDAAQMSRLIQAQTYRTGVPVEFGSLGAFGCSVEITKPMLTGECQVVIPGGGERAIAQTESQELCFAIPANKIEATMIGIEQTHKAGIKYPVATYLTYEAQFPPGYMQLMEILKEKNPD
jgi:uncharacterized protein (DUF169 family)